MSYQQEAVQFIRLQAPIAERYAQAGSHALAAQSCLWSSLRKFDALSEDLQSVAYEDMKRIVLASASALTPGCRLILSFLAE